MEKQILKLLSSNGLKLYSYVLIKNPQLLNDSAYFPDSLTIYNANQILYMSWKKISIQISERERN